MNIMNDSRREKREFALAKAAESGKYSVTLKLFSSEARRLERNGFMVIRHDETKENHKRALYSTVSWENAFVSGYSQFVLSYLSGEIRTFPPNLNLAQQLNITAKKKNIKEGNETLPLVR